ncbi:AmmeMemoRadiSam system radical SAM enzyme [Bifidobacterium callitrichos]|uniref:AmmeMemoRadiSam system radical SAM enzyme n=2 Tax=Bifidobacterium callitrichos TaxID=762209 RepID=A0A5M9ZGT6_9BIFI|nr:AmmeMemoRadiSam system radical SAM enzyme [Bifidobacterium callitrichos]KAA8817682.1 AmmeMemoRadiSam system radical SAM enzyme [Bifidobacterium callitrichos]KFI56104.1 pyruvate formate-lyase activating enzyme [Bifidobacterium callitrichos DSM 23973]
MPSGSDLRPQDTFGPALGRWQTRFDDGTGRARCELCPRRCVLKPGQRGFCFVRSNHDGVIVSDTYGRSSGFAVDPVEKKPLNHFHPGSSVLSFGTAGCNSGCRFCQNWDISRARDYDRLGVEASPERIARVAADRGIDSVAFTYNDPIVFAEYAIDTAYACRARGIHPIAVTAGYMAAPARADFYDAMDAANIDLKGFTEDFYWKVTGTHLQDVLDTIDYAVNEARIPDGRHVWVELTTLLIPGLNDDDAQLHAECTWIREHCGPDVPLHFSAFHPAWKMTDVPPTPHATLTRARGIALDEGLHYVYTGNVHDTDGDTTYCPNPSCRTPLVVRDWYRIIDDRLTGGTPAGESGNDGRDAEGVRCPECGTVIAGRW